MSPNTALARGRDLARARSMEESRVEKKEKGDSDGIIRLLFASVGGAPIKSNNDKNILIQKWISDSDADIIGMAETNIYWDKAKHGPFALRCKKWISCSRPQYTTNINSIVANNELDELADEYQIGGVAMITRGGLSGRIEKNGIDLKSGQILSFE